MQKNFLQLCKVQKKSLQLCKVQKKILQLRKVHTNILQQHKVQKNILQLRKVRCNFPRLVKDVWQKQCHNYIVVQYICPTVHAVSSLSTGHVWPNDLI